MDGDRLVSPSPTPAGEQVGAGLAEPLDAAAATTGASVLSGGVWKAAALMLPQAYALVQSIVAARILGPSGMGVQSFIAFSSISLVTLASNGLSISLMRYVGELLGRGRAGELRDLVRWGLRLQVIGSVLTFGVLGVAALAGASPRAAWALAAVAAAAAVLHTVPSAVLIGAQRWRDASIVGLATGAFATVAVVAVLAAGGGITGMFAVDAVIGVVNLAWTTLLGRRALARVAAAPRTVSESLRRGARSYALFATCTSVVTLIVWRRSELFFLQHYSDSSEIAFYSIAFSVVTTLVALPQSLSDVVSPAVATLFGAGDEERIARGYGRGARLLVLLSLPVTAIALAVGPETLRVIWGQNYSRAGTVFLILIAPVPLIPLISFARSFLTGIGLIRVPLLVMIVAGVVNIGLDFVFVPRFDAIGAAIANVCAQLAAGLPILVYTRGQVGGIRWDAGALARATLASALAGGAAWGLVSLLGGAVGVVIGLAAGAVVMAVLGALLRILPADDAHWLADAAGAKFGGLLGRGIRRWGGEPTAAS